MKISVIIPTYKPKDYIWECLESLVKQTFPKKDFEVILVLNGCTEPWKSEIENYVAKEMQSMNVTYIHTKQGGVSNARNLALDNAKGEYVTFIDDDDFVSPRFLEELYSKADPLTISLCYPYAFNDGEKEIQLPYTITDAYDHCVARNITAISSKVRIFFSGPWMKLIPMSFIQNRRYDVRFKNGEDSLFMFLISDKFKNFTFTSRDAIYYRRYREGSAVTGNRESSEILKTGLLQTKVYLSYYFKKPYSYNLIFFITRLLACIHSIIFNLRNAYAKNS